MANPSVSVRTNFNLTEELHNTIIQSLVSSFGLDFLLFDDKKGGNVATTHNVRAHKNGDSDIYIPDSVKQDYSERGKYNSQEYHSDKRYTDRGAADKKLQHTGDLHDLYRNKQMKAEENRQLDHVVSASEIHDDAGRVLSGLDGSYLANQNSNFQSTHYYINNLKSNHTIEQFLTKELPKAIASKKVKISKAQDKLATMPTTTPEQRHNKRLLEGKIAKHKEHIETLESVDHNKMREADKITRKKYDSQINAKYYTSSKFLKSTAFDATKSGLKMGMRQALGLILAEVWFELKEHLPSLCKGINGKFTMESFLKRLKQLGLNIWNRVKARFKDILAEFKNGAIAGVLSSLTTTIMNIFFTTQKLIGKLLREMWTSLVSAAKLIFFNPNKLSAGDLVREITRVISIGVSVAMGVILNQYLASIMAFPLGTELAAFVSAVATGLMALGITYFLDHSELMQKVWDFLNQFKTEGRRTLEYFQKVNAQLDNYLVELTALEFNLDPQEMTRFNDNLVSVNSEHERGLVLAKEVKNRGIKLPFESGNLDSTRSWLGSL